MTLRHEMLAATDLVGFTSQAVVRHSERIYGLVQLNVRDLTYSRSVGVFLRKKTYLSPTVQRLIESLKATARTTLTN